MLWSPFLWEWKWKIWFKKKKQVDWHAPAPWIGSVPCHMGSFMRFCRFSHPHRSCRHVCCQSWRNLWRSMPRLNIDEADFNIYFGVRYGDLNQRWERIENFTTNLLLFHDYTSCLGEFRISCHLYNKCHVDWWIRRGIEYCPAKLQIQIYSFSDHDRFKLPPVSGSSFRHLKTLCIQNVDLNRHFTDLLRSGFPFLEDLELNYCDFCGNYPQCITSPSLKKLMLEYCHNNTSHTLVITAPNLVYLAVEYGCYQADHYTRWILLSKYHFIWINRTLPQKTRQELMGSLSNVTSLELMGFEAEVCLLA